MAAAARGRGVGTLALRGLTAWLFSEQPTTGRLGGYTRYDNLAMRRVFDECGFQQEALHRREPVDRVGYAILRDELELPSGACARLGLVASRCGMPLALGERMQTFIRTKLMRKRRRALCGFSLIEVVVAIAIIAMVSGGVVVAVMKHQAESQKKMTRVNAGAIRMGVKSWWIEHSASECPSVKKLVDDGAIDRGKAVSQDAWGQPWKIVCEAHDATVISRGPDKTPDTEDDIRVPQG